MICSEISLKRGKVSMEEEMVRDLAQIVPTSLRARSWKGCWGSEEEVLKAVRRWETSW